MHPLHPSRTRSPIAFALAIGLLVAISALFQDAGGARLVAQTPATLASTIFSYDGLDFIRTQTTLLTEAGKSAVNTKLDQNSPAYKALTQKHSYTGDATIFGKRYSANYAPLMDPQGRLTGALFVAVPK